MVFIPTVALLYHNVTLSDNFVISPGSREPARGRVFLPRDMKGTYSSRMENMCTCVYMYAHVHIYK